MTIQIGGSLRWLLTGRAVQIFLQIVGMAVLARLVKPADFGLLALTGVVTVFLQLFTDLGTSAALIQKSELRNEEINAVFWLNITAGFMLMIAVAFGAPFIADLLGDAKVTPALRLVSVAFLLSSLTATHVALFERHSHFRELTVFSSLAAVVGLFVAILLATRNFGIYALIMQTLVTSSVQAILIWKNSKWRPTKPSFIESRDLLSFSGNLFTFNLLNYFHRNADTIIIGRIFGQEALGHYNVAYRILLFPLQNLTFAISRSLLPEYSRLQGDTRAVRDHYIVTLRSIALITAPLMAAVWFTRDSLIFSLLGPSWSQSAQIIAWLAPVGFIQSIGSTSGAVLLSQGRSDILRNLGIIGVPLLTASFFLGIPWGIQGIASSYCIANFLWFLPVQATVIKILGGKLGIVISSIIPPALIAVICFGFTSTFLSDIEISPSLELITICISGASLYLFALRIFLWKSVYKLFEIVWQSK